MKREYVHACIMSGKYNTYFHYLCCLNEPCLHVIKVYITVSPDCTKFMGLS